MHRIKELVNEIGVDAPVSLAGHPIRPGEKHRVNILALGGRTTAPELACQIVDAWLDSEFEGGRHARRIALIDEI